MIIVTTILNNNIWIIILDIFMQPYLTLHNNLSFKKKEVV